MRAVTLAKKRRARSGVSSGRTAPRTPYERAVATPQGRAWLARHPEVQEVHVLANLLRAWESRLLDADRTLGASDRVELTARVRAVARAVAGVTDDAGGRRRAMRAALDLGAATLRRLPTIGGAQLATVVRLHLEVDLGSGSTARVDDATIERAARAWGKSRRTWTPILELAKAIGAVLRDTSSASLRQTLAREE